MPRTPLNSRENPRIAALVLAAGASTRFGPGNKLLYRWRDRPFIEHVLAPLASGVIDGRLDRVLVVTGHDAAVVVDAVERASRASGTKAIATVHNPAWASGMASSLVCGVSMLLDCDAILVCLGDMPEVEGVVLERLVDAWRAAPRHAFVAPVHDGRRGNPVLVTRRLFESVLALAGDTGARELAKRYPEHVLEVTTDCAAVLRDYDTAESVARLGE